MKQYLLTGVFLLFSAAFSYADPGSRFCIYATVVTTTDNKVYKGYFDIGGFDLSLLKDSTGYHYYTPEQWIPVNIREESERTSLRVAETENNFFSYVQDILHDTLVLHSNVFLIPLEEEGFPVPAYVGEACRIPKSKIKSFTVTSMTEGSVLYNTGPQLTLEDLTLKAK
jgi:hypothetical protein